MRRHSTVIIAVIAGLSLIGKVVGDARRCCRDRGVSQECTQALCNPAVAPNDMQRYSIFDSSTKCIRYLSDIAECLVDGRDSTDCCYREADRPDEDSCLGLCKGSAAKSEKKASYQSCFAINAGSIYSCIDNAYAVTPTSPLNLRIIDKTGQSVHLSWERPSQNAGLVHIYKVHITETSDKSPITIIHDTRETRLLINNLKENGNYSAYVVAHAAELERKSRSSEAIHFSANQESTNGGLAYSEQVQIPRNSDTATLSCHLKIGVDGKQKVGLFYVLIKEPRFKAITYTEDVEQPRYIVSALEISDLEHSDFGHYRCRIQGSNHEYAEIVLQAYSHSIAQPPKSPPESPTQCCAKTIQRKHCESICTMASNQQPSPVRPGNFLPRFDCVNEFQNLLKCTLSEMNSASCCIKKMIPYHCLGMCDSRYEMDYSMRLECLGYMDKVFECQNETTEKLPAAVSFVKANSDSENVSLEWQKSSGADVYHVYSRRRRSQWNNKVVTSPNVHVDNADEIIVLAVNAHGSSAPNRLALVDNHWIGNYES
ncbi:hypothetical protein WR25_18939 [Diploscapter pachys]|uniref:Fibronectin type-III domain-containing protein n=1 Tax=Diploscapter pachys TaxID=2018661 RepID=A0A2A2K8W8_9BILA|nr:hypothetical protein WR25_18939 [Diploscapter pachys]